MRFGAKNCRQRGVAEVARWKWEKLEVGVDGWMQWTIETKWKAGLGHNTKVELCSEGKLRNL